jgi:hypothetical protein
VRGDQGFDFAVQGGFRASAPQICFSVGGRLFQSGREQMLDLLPLLFCAYAWVVQTMRPRRGSKQGSMGRKNGVISAQRPPVRHFVLIVLLLTRMGRLLIRSVRGG